jgi:hypothetical protein
MTDKPSECPTKAPRTHRPTQAPTECKMTDKPSECPTKAPRTRKPTQAPSECNMPATPTKAPTECSGEDEDHDSDDKSCDKDHDSDDKSCDKGGDEHPKHKHGPKSLIASAEVSEYRGATDNSQRAALHLRSR